MIRFEKPISAVEYALASLLRDMILQWMNRGLAEDEISDRPLSRELSSCIGAIIYAWRKYKPEPPPDHSINLIKAFNILSGLQQWLNEIQSLLDGEISNLL